MEVRKVTPVVNIYVSLVVKGELTLLLLQA